MGIPSIGGREHDDGLATPLHGCLDRQLLAYCAAIAPVRATSPRDVGIVGPTQTWQFELESSVDESFKVGVDVAVQSLE